MNKTEYRSAVAPIQPSQDFYTKTISYLQRAQSERKQMKSRRRLFRPAVWTGAAALVCLTIAIMFFSGVPGADKIWTMLRPGAAQTGQHPTSGPTASLVASSSSMSGTSSLCLDGSPVLYSSLKFAAAAAVDRPADLTGGGLADMAMPGNYALYWPDSASLVVKATVMEVHFNRYPVKFQVKKEDYKAFLTDEENQFIEQTIFTIVHEIRIDRVYYADGSGPVQPGDLLVIENSLQYQDPDGPGSGLQPDHQYILTVSRGSGDLVSPADRAQYDAVIGQTTAESPYFMMFTFTPQIELTLDGGYLFYANEDVKVSKPQAGIGSGWVGLINDETVRVILDGQTGALNPDDSSNALYRDNMRLRADSDFEADFQNLVNQYLGP